MTSIIFLILQSSCTSIHEQRGDKIDASTFVNQFNQEVSTEDFLGSYWIASFIFTNCDTVCPPMMRETANLQKMFAQEQIDVQFISFSVDPEVDTPNVLYNYIQEFTQDQSNWHLLTGISQQEIEQFAREQFQTIVQKPESSSQVIHSTNFYLVDDQGYVFGEYNYIDETYKDDMLQDIKKLNRLNN